MLKCLRSLVVVASYAHRTAAHSGHCLMRSHLAFCNYSHVTYTYLQFCIDSRSTRQWRHRSFFQKYKFKCKVKGPDQIFQINWASFSGCWTWNSNTLTTWYEELTHWKRSWCWERLKAGGERDDRGWDGWMASPTQRTWVWVTSRRWWWTGKPSVLQSMGLQRVRHDWETEVNWASF